MWLRDARGRWHRSGQGLRRGILLGLRETAKSIAAGPELACGSDSRPCRNNAVSRSPSSNHPSSAAARPDATFLWRPSTTSTPQNLKNIPDCIHSRTDASFLWRPSIPPPKKPRCPANTTLPDTRAKRTNVKRIFTIHLATCS